jgi:preprotein translocase subunit SecA
MEYLSTPRSAGLRTANRPRFIQTLDAIDARAVESFTALDITPGGVGLEGLRLRGPSSTWTYLINDDPFTDGLAATMMSGRNIGFAASAALIGPLLILWALSRRFGRRSKR